MFVRSSMFVLLGILGGCSPDQKMDPFGEWAHSDGLELPAPPPIRGDLTIGRYVVTGDGHSCVLDVGYNMWLGLEGDPAAARGVCFGDNSFGQLGKLGGGTSPVPVSIPDARFLDAGRAQTCLADGVTQDMLCANAETIGFESVGLGKEPKYIGAGDDHVCVIDSDGALSCIGDDSRGQLMAPNGKFDWVVAGGDQSCAIESNELQAWCWGNDLAAAPVDLSGFKTHYMDVGHDHACAVTDGGLYCWGDNSFGQAGASLDTGEVLDPRPVDLPRMDVMQVAAGHRHTCVVYMDFTMACFGEGIDGQLGNGDYENVDAASAIPVELPSAAYHIDVGEAHTCAVLDSGRVACWGDSEFGQAGVNGGSTANPTLLAKLGEFGMPYDLFPETNPGSDTDFPFDTDPFFPPTAPVDLDMAYVVKTVPVRPGVPFGKRTLRLTDYGFPMAEVPVQCVFNTYDAYGSAASTTWSTEGLTRFDGTVDVTHTTDATDHVLQMISGDVPLHATSGSLTCMSDPGSGFERLTTTVEVEIETHYEENPDPVLFSEEPDNIVTTWDEDYPGEVVEPPGEELEEPPGEGITPDPQNDPGPKPGGGSNNCPGGGGIKAPLEVPSSGGCGSGSKGVDAADGSFDHGEQDLATANGIRPDGELDRNYRSTAEGSSPLGPGWDHSLNRWAHTDTATGEVTLFLGIGRQTTFQKSTGSSYEAPCGVYSTMRMADQGTPATDDDVYELMTYGVVQRYSVDLGVLLEIEDLAGGGKLTFEYDPDDFKLVAMRDAVSAFVPGDARKWVFEYDGKTRLSAVRLWTGRAMEYGYFEGLVGPDGYLATATHYSPKSTVDPMVGYTYAIQKPIPGENALLKSIIRPDEAASYFIADWNYRSFHPDFIRSLSYLENEYNGAEQVERQRLSNEGVSIWDDFGVFKYAYYGDHTDLVDRMNRNSTRYFDTAGNLVQVDIEGLKIRDGDPYAPPGFSEESVHTTTLQWSASECQITQSSAVGGMTVVITPVVKPGYEHFPRYVNVGGDVWQYSYNFDRMSGVVVPALERLIDPSGTMTVDTRRDRFGMMRAKRERMATIYDHDGPAGIQPAQDVKYSYDGWGNLISIQGTTLTKFERYSGTPATAHQTGHVAEVHYNVGGNAGELLGMGFEFDDVGNPVVFIDGAGERWVTEVDDYGNDIGSYSPNGLKKTTREFSADGELRIARVFDPVSGETYVQRFENDRLGNLSKTIIEVDSDPANDIVNEVYRDYEENLEWVIYAGGGYEHIVVDERNLVYTVTSSVERAAPGSGGSDVVGVQRTFFDAQGNEILWVDEEGHAITYVRDAVGRLKELIDAEGTKQVLTYDKAGRVDTMEAVSPTLEVMTRTTWIRNERDVLVRTQFDWFAGTVFPEAGGQRHTWQYDPSGGIAKRFAGSTNSNSQIRERRYHRDGLGRVTKAEEINEGVVAGTMSYFYDVASRVDYIEQTHAPGNVITFDYTRDAAGRVNAVAETAPGEAPKVHTVKRDGRDLVVEIIDAKNNLRRKYHDGAGRQVLQEILRTDDGTGAGSAIDTVIQEWEYDLDSNLVNLIDGKQRETSWTHDDQGNILTELHADGAYHESFWNLDGTLQRAIDANGTETQFQYDGRKFITDRVVTKFGPGVVGHDADHFMYNANADITEAWNDNVHQYFTFDGLGQTLSETHEFPDTQTFTVGVDYFELGGIETLRYPGTRADVTYERDDLARIKSVKSSDGLSIGRTYLGLHQSPATTFNPAGVIDSRTVDGFGRPKTYRNPGVDQPQSFDTTFDERDQVAELIRLSDGTKSTYGFGSTGELISAIYDYNGLGVPKYDILEYDEAGTPVVNSGSTAGLTVPGDAGEIVSKNGVFFDHDANGNTTYNGFASFEYDSLDRVIKGTTDTGGVFNRTLDPFGRVIEEIDPSGVPFRRIWFDLDCVEIFDLNGDSLRSFVPGDFINEVIAMRDGGDDLFPLMDSFLNVVGLVDKDLKLLESYRINREGGVDVFDANGLPRNGSAYHQERFRQGAILDPVALTYGHFNRDLDSTTGRFTSRDRDGQQPEDMLNFYTLGDGDPGGRDPFGGDGLEDYVPGVSATKQAKQLIEAYTVGATDLAWWQKGLVIGLGVIGGAAQVIDEVSDYVAPIKGGLKNLAKKGVKEGVERVVKKNADDAAKQVIKKIDDVAEKAAEKAAKKGKAKPKPKPKKNKPDLTPEQDKLAKRGSFRKKSRDDAEARSRKANDGKLLCETCGKDVSKNITRMVKGKPQKRVGYDLDHYPETWAERKADFMGRILSGDITRKEILDIYNANLRVQCPPCNQGHKFEGIKGAFGPD